MVDGARKPAERPAQRIIGISCLRGVDLRAAGRFEPDPLHHMT